MNKTGQKGRPPAKQDFLEAELKRAIVRGDYPPGCRLPTRQQLLRRYKASSATLQQALHRLAKDRFVCARGREGTFVSDSPPHLHNHALVLPVHHTSIRSRLWMAMEEGGRTLAADGQSVTTIEYNPWGEPTQSAHVQLERGLSRHLYCGVILTSRTPQVLSLVQAFPEVPKVLVAPLDPVMPGVSMEMRRFWERAMEELRAVGCRRIATVALTGGADADNLILAAARKVGVEIPRYFMLSAHLAALSIIQATMQLLMQLPEDRRPEGLIIGDDNMAEDTCKGLLAAGVKGPEQLRIICHANFPSPPPQLLPMRMLGFDCVHVLRACTRILQRQRDARPNAELDWSMLHESIVPHFEDEPFEATFCPEPASPFPITGSTATMS